MTNLNRGVAAALLVFSFGPSVCAAPEDRYVVNTSHVGAVNDLKYHDGEEVLVSVGEDGTIRIWDTRRKRALHRIQASSLPVVLAAIHPDKPHVAVVSTDTISEFTLSVWDWDSGSLLYARDIEDVPQYMAFSPRGSYLIYSRLDIRSLTVLDADTGRQLSLLENSFGIVTGFLIPEQEHMLVAYLPTGKIQYLETRTGDTRHEFDTLSSITDVYFTTDDRYMVGIHRDSVVAIDLVTGDEVDRLTIDRLQKIHFEKDSSTLLVLHQTPEEQPNFDYYVFRSGRFVSRYSSFDPPPDGRMTVFMENNNRLYTGSEDGTIHDQSRFYSSPRVLAENQLADIQGFLPGESLLLTTQTNIVTFYSDYLAGARPSTRKNDVLFFAQENPMQSETGVAATENGMYLLWDQTAVPGRMVLYSPVFGIYGEPFDQFESRLADVDVRDNEALTLEANGTIRVTDLESYEVSHERSEAPGLLNAVAFVDGAGIAAGGRRFPVLETTMYHIDTETYETVPLPSAGSFTQLLEYDADTDTLYSITTNTSDNRPTVSITAHTGETYETSTRLYMTHGERVQVSLDASEGMLFYSVDGKNYLQYARSGRTIEIESNNNIPVQVFIHGEWLYAVNRDSSITLWNRYRGEQVLDFYLFKNLEWAVITTNGSFLSSEAGSEFVEAYSRENVLQ